MSTNDSTIAIRNANNPTDDTVKFSTPDRGLVWDVVVLVVPTIVLVGNVWFFAPIEIPNKSELITISNLQPIPSEARRPYMQFLDVNTKEKFNGVVRNFTFEQRVLVNFFQNDRIPLELSVLKTEYSSTIWEIRNLKSEKIVTYEEFVEAQLLVFSKHKHQVLIYSLIVFASLLSFIRSALLKRKWKI